MTHRDLPHYANLRDGDLMRPRGDAWRYLRGVLARVTPCDVRAFVWFLLLICGPVVALLAWGV